MTHPNHALPVAATVRKLQDEPFNPILLYKQFGDKDDRFPDLPADSFMLVIQTEHQKELFERYSFRILCVDSTHNTNQYGYKLITIMVRDDTGQGKQLLYKQAVYVVH